MGTSARSAESPYRYDFVGTLRRWTGILIALVVVWAILALEQTVYEANAAFGSASTTSRCSPLPSGPVPYVR